MAEPYLDFDDVSFWYLSPTEPILEGFTAHLPGGWTGLVGPNGAGKTTLLKLACGVLQPSGGAVRVGSEPVFCEQRTDDPPADLSAFMEAWDGEACRLKSRLGVEPDWLARWSSLSHGERKRAQVAVALWRRPHVLALDEPTNHVDRDARDMIRDALSAFDGAGLVVSHDRGLLDELCDRCIVIGAGRAVVRPGGFTEAMELERREREHARREHEKAQVELSRLRRAAVKRAEQVRRDRSKDSKRRLARGDSDAREKIDRARVTGKDAASARALRQMDGRLRQVRERLASTRVVKDRPTGVNVLGERAGCDFLVRSGPFDLPLGPERHLHVPQLVLKPADRVALVGPNGAGKSTLLEHLVGRLDLPDGRLFYLPQEVETDRADELLADIRGLPSAELGVVMSLVSRLGSEPERLLETLRASPGEMRKALLAMALRLRPHLIVLDEPTNHLDAVSVDCLERALSDCECALLLVSHDRRFLRALTTSTWRIDRDGEDSVLRAGRAI